MHAPLHSLHISLSLLSPFPLSISLSLSVSLSLSIFLFSLSPLSLSLFPLYVRYTHALFIICLCCNFFTTIQDNQDVHDFTGELTSCRELFVGHTGCNSCIMLFIFVHVSLMFVAFYGTVFGQKIAVIQGMQCGGGEGIGSQVRVLW